MSIQAARRVANHSAGRGSASVSYSRRRAAERREARQRLAQRVARPVAPERRQRDPLRRDRKSPLRRAARLMVYAGLALVLHAGAVFGITEIGSALGPNEPPGPAAEQVTLRVVDPPRLPAPEIAPEVESIEAPAVPEPELPEKVLPRPAPPRGPRQKREPIPADPIDTREPPPAAEPAPARRVVGLSMESTVTGGSGPAFAVGNTRMGRTGEVAENPAGVQKLAPSAKGSGSGAAGPNRTASALPGGSVAITKPRRLSQPALVYPSVLKSQGIEGNVSVMIRIAADGRVLSAKVLKSSGYEQFDTAARAAALKERFAPATRGGEPVEYTLKYTYRFRIKDA